MRKLIVSEFVSLDGVMQAPGGKDEDTDGGFKHGGWTWPYWHDDLGADFATAMKDTDAFLLGRRTYLLHANAFEPLPKGDFFGDLMNAPTHYVVSKTLDKPAWRNTVIIRDNPMQAIRELKQKPGKNIFTDGSSQLVHEMLENDLLDELHLLVYPVVLGGGKRVIPEGMFQTFKLESAKTYPSGVVGLNYVRER